MTSTSNKSETAGQKSLGKNNLDSLHPENKADVINAIGSLDEALSKQTFNAFVYPSSRHQTEAMLEIPQFGRCENYCTSNETASSQPPKDLRIEISKRRRHRADLYKHFLKVNETPSALTDWNK